MVVPCANVEQIGFFCTWKVFLYVLLVFSSVVVESKVVIRGILHCLISFVSVFVTNIVFGCFINVIL